MQEAVRLATKTQIDEWPASVLPKGISVGETPVLNSLEAQQRVYRMARATDNPPRAATPQTRPRTQPDIKISAAVFGGYPACVTSIGQDWVAWAKAGYLDFVCPMNYTEDTTDFTDLLENQLSRLPKGFTIYPGIGATATNSLLTADAVVGQIYLARFLGAAGWTIFDYSVDISDTVLPAIGMGIGAQPAQPAH